MKGPLRLFVYAMRKASGNDLEHTVTCLAAEPLGLLMSEDVNNWDSGNFMGHIPITNSYSAFAKDDCWKMFNHNYKPINSRKRITKF